jgi:hypothetical protein
MLRATIIAVIAVGVVLVHAADAQRAPKLPVVGILASNQPRNGPPYPAFERALREVGLVDGQNIKIEFRMAEGKIERLPGLAAELVRAERTSFWPAEPSRRWKRRVVRRAPCPSSWSPSITIRSTAAWWRVSADQAARSPASSFGRSS